MKKGILIGKGRTAEVYKWDEGLVLKLFYEGFPAHIIEQEYNSSRVICLSGLPVPNTTDYMVETEGRKGIIYEHILGNSMFSEMKLKPWKIIRLAKKLAEIHAAIHKSKIDNLPSQRQGLEYSISNAAELPKHIKEAALHILFKLPDGKSLCHGDFHPDNILLSPRGEIIIDWSFATLGNPLADLARTSMLLQLGEVPPGTPVKWFFDCVRSVIHSTYINRYFKLNPASFKEYETWLIPVMAARFIEHIPSERTRLLEKLEKLLGKHGWDFN